MLDDIVVLDLTRALAGPHAAMMLGDLGARVIKIEAPGGDDTRGWGPPFVGPADEFESTYFLSCNRNKESMVLDLKSAAGRDLLERLVRQVDVLIENFRPGVMDRLGFSADRLRALNQGLVICSISGFGHDGPEGGRAGYDQIAQGEAGLMSLTGSSADDPNKVGVPIGDVLAGMNAAFGVVAALHDRSRTGIGHVVRTSLLSSIVGVHAFQGTRWTIAHEVPAAIGNHHPSISPYGAFKTAGGMIQIAVGSESQWRSLADALGLGPDEPDFATNALRVARRHALTRQIEAALAKQPSAYWLKTLADLGVPCGKVRTIDEVYTWDQTASQGLLLELDHPVLGPITVPGSPLRFDDNAYSGAKEKHRPPPVLGQHNSSIEQWLEDMETAAAVEP